MTVALRAGVSGIAPNALDMDGSPADTEAAKQRSVICAMARALCHTAREGVTMPSKLLVLVGVWLLGALATLVYIRLAIAVDDGEVSTDAE